MPDVLHEGPGFCYADELFVDKAEGYISRVHLAFRRPIAKGFTPSTKQRSLPEEETTALLVSALTTPATTVLSYSIPMATTSKPCSTGQLSAVRRPLSSRSSKQESVRHRHAA